MTNVLDSLNWLTHREVADLLGLPQGKVRRLVEEHSLLGMKRGRDYCIPADFLLHDEPLAGLRGTLILLLDGGFSEQEALEWLFGEDESLGESPVSSLRRGRKTQVRHAVQLLGL
ncbi:excisionase family DNA-binding protein [Pseudoclavibacter alba]|uniref:Rv2175c family DNA-binding protein n=1 Tax=Pseudoclavibacter albus TaxID=272241 RepID=UPI0019D1FA08|nr:excisionase family DNA-binding protein [Pseudoclavibacter alba]